MTVWPGHVDLPRPSIWQCIFPHSDQCWPWSTIPPCGFPPTLLLIQAQPTLTFVPLPSLFAISPPPPINLPSPFPNLYSESTTLDATERPCMGQASPWPREQRLKSSRRYRLPRQRSRAGVGWNIPLLGLPVQIVLANLHTNINTNIITRHKRTTCLPLPSLDRRR